MALMSSKDRDTKSNYKAPRPGLQELVHMKTKENCFSFFHIISLDCNTLFICFSNLHNSFISIHDVTEITCAGLAGLDEFFAICDSLLFLLIHKTAWNKLCAKLLSQSSQRM
jgi:hypothetical protein